MLSIWLTRSWEISQRTECFALSVIEFGYGPLRLARWVGAHPLCERLAHSFELCGTKAREIGLLAGIACQVVEAGFAALRGNQLERTDLNRPEIIGEGPGPENPIFALVDMPLHLAAAVLGHHRSVVRGVAVNQADPVETGRDRGARDIQDGGQNIDQLYGCLASDPPIEDARKPHHEGYSQ